MTAFAFNEDAAKRLPQKIKFGTSSWTYQGWRDLVYFNKYANSREFNRQSLGEYVRCPWFRTVGIDSSFYGPPSPKTLEQYASLSPNNFQWVAKVWERLTIPHFPALPRYGKDAGQKNADFLNFELFSREVITPLSSPTIRPHVGPLVFQFPTVSPAVMSAPQFFAHLRQFLSKLPTAFQYAVEVRNPEFLVNPYFDALNEFSVTHCFNHWHRMPALKLQMKAAAVVGGLRANFFVARILTPLGVSYEGAVKLFSPYSEIRRLNPEMRADVTRLALRAVERDADAYIIVNNRSEGCAPMTIDGIGQMIVSEL